MCAEGVVFGRSIRCHIPTVTLYCTSFFLLEVSLGMEVKPAGMRCVSADSTRERAGGHTGLPWRLCGLHMMTVYRLSTADVMLYYVVFSSDTVSNLTMVIKAKTRTRYIICI